jgi:hypothetical protein
MNQAMSDISLAWMAHIHRWALTDGEEATFSREAKNQPLYGDGTHASPLLTRLTGHNRV